MTYLESIALILKQEGFMVSGINSTNKSIDIDSLIEAFNRFNNVDNKRKLIVQIGHSRDSRFFDFLLYCIFCADDFNIRHGTLKYLPYYKGEKDLNPLFERIVSSGQRNDYEPYFSIALGMIGGECKERFLVKQVE
jgi:hypothetical protein